MITFIISKQNWLKLFIILIVFINVVACKSSKAPPIVDGISAPQQVDLKDEITIEAKITWGDYNNKEINYNWMAEKGHLKTNGQKVITYIAPNVEGQDTITLSLKYDEYSITKSITITIVAPPPIEAESPNPAPPSFTYTIQVLDLQSKKPISSAKVILQFDHNSVFKLTKSDGQAKFNLPDTVLTQIIEVWFSAENYITGNRELNLTEDNSTYTIELELMPTPTPHNINSNITPTVIVFPTSTPTPIPTSTDVPILTDNKTIDSWVNLRSGPGTDYEVITQLPPNQSVRILYRSEGRFEGWWYVETINPDEETEGEQGWIGKDLIKNNSTINVSIIPIASELPPPPSSQFEPPKLVAPEPNAGFEGPNANIELSWTWEGELEANEYFFIVGFYVHKDNCDNPENRTQFTEHTKEKRLELSSDEYQWFYDAICDDWTEIEWMVFISTTEADTAQNYFNPNVEKRILNWQ